MVDRLHAAIVVNCWTKFLVTLCSVHLLVGGLASGEEIEFRPVAISVEGMTKPPNEENPTGISLSPDGRCLFAYRSSGGDTLSIYRREAESGKLSRASSLGFPPVLAARVDAVTPDSRVAFVLDSRSILWSFQLDSAKGMLAPLGKIENGKGDVHGMVSIGGCSLSPDGRFLYVECPPQRAVFCFRVSEQGDLSFVECLQSPAAGKAAVDADQFPRSTRVPNARLEPNFNGASRLACTPDGRHMVGVSVDSVVLLSRDPKNGRLSYVDSIEEVPQRLVTNLRGAVDLALNAAGTHIVTCSRFGGVTLLKLNHNTGSLNFLEAHVDQDKLAIGPTPTLKKTQGLQNTSDVVWSPDGKWVFAASYGDHAIVAFRFDAENEQLVPTALLQQDREGVKGLYGVESIAISPDGKFLYAGSRDATATVFEIITAK